MRYVALRHQAAHEGVTAVSVKVVAALAEGERIRLAGAGAGDAMN